jgi:hypothetical protein|tara:strand:+ start:82 stop:387 length:306 start_codon:yes stop_codon:yes gene_type:complete
MAERPRNRKVDRGLIDQGGVTPLRALMVGLLNRRERKKDRKYQKSLKKMGMFDEGGGRANVPPKKKKTTPKKNKPMKVYKTAKGGKIDGIAIRGKTKGTIR